MLRQTDDACRTHRQARYLIDKNKELMEKSGAHTLVTSCPICYKTFVRIIT
jgi:Fe-S oxidoreductase